ncbi:hypothetical protein EB001_19645 [bacterium]|nr:hypothetical protein [bacterium]
MKNKIIELKSKQQLDAWNNYSYITEPSLEIKYIKNLEDTLFFQGSGAARRRIAPYQVPDLKTTDPEVKQVVNDYNASVIELEKAFNEWDKKRIDMLAKLRELSTILPKPYDDISVIYIPTKD